MAQEHDQENYEDMLAEIDAMHIALKVTNSQTTPCEQEVTEARSLIRTAFKYYSPSKTPDAQVIACAMAHILGEDVRKFIPKTPVQDPWERHVSETVGRAWACWAADPNSPTPSEEMSRLRREQASREASEGSGAIHLMALFFWVSAIEALSKRDMTEARRFWLRAMEVGSSHGTDSHPVVLWTFAATFFPW